jgi:glycosyltransferase involved in cell wall biosynthesis
MMHVGRIKKMRRRLRSLALLIDRFGSQPFAYRSYLVVAAARYDRRNLAQKDMNGMRIVYVLTSLGVGGAEHQVLELAARMEHRGHQVALVVLREPVKEHLEHWEHCAQWPATVRLEHLRLRKRPLSFVRALAQANRIARQFRAEVVHSHSFHANVFARLMKMRLHAPALVCTVHNVYEGGWPRMLAYRLTDSLCARTTAVSEAAAERFVRLRAVPAHKCAVVVNGVDVDRLIPDAERRVRMRLEMGAGEEFVWLAAGRLVPAKDYPNLLRAFARVHGVNSEAILWIAGEAKDGASKDNMNCPLRALAAALGIAGRVQWLGLRRDLPALLDAADGFVLASAWEGMPLVLAEAMAKEKTVIATDVGGVRELVGETGSIVSAQDAEALAEAMVTAMQLSCEERAARGRAARERIVQRFSIDARADDWERLYEDVLRAV